MGALTVRDYIYARLGELKSDLASGPGPRREQAKEERDFLERQLGMVRGQVKRSGGKTVVVDPRLADGILKGSEREAAKKAPPPTSRPRGEDVSGGGGPKKGRKRPPYWPSCEGMRFRELREFIDDSLHGSQQASEQDRPRSKHEFLELLELLARKGGVAWERTKGKPTWDSGAARREHQRLAASRDKVRKALMKATRDAPAATLALGGTTKSVKRLKQELDAAEKKMVRLGGTDVSDRSTARRRIVARIFGDTQRVFAEGGPGARPPSDGPLGRAGGMRLPWRVLPWGELTLERVLAHYRRLGRSRPDIRYEPERLAKAWSLKPDGCYVGSGEFDGYVVFTFAWTNKALLERPVYGNAIYVLGPEWKRLSRLSKGELLAEETHGVTKIVHKGEWFSRTKRALGL